MASKGESKQKEQEKDTAKEGGKEKEEGKDTAKEGIKEKEKEKEKEKKDGIINAVYKVNMHCQKCARDIKKPLMRTQGVQNVEVDMEKGEIRAKGIFDPIKIHKQIERLSKKKTELISPKIQIKEKDTSKVDQKPKETKQEISRTTSVKVHMHCEQCEKDLKKKLLKRKDIYSVKTDMKAQTLTVDGTIEPEKLINLLRKKVHKHAEIIASKPDKKDEKKDMDKGEKDEKKDKDKGEKDEKKDKEKEGKSSTSTSESAKIVEINKEETKVVEVKAKDSNAPYFVHYVYAPQLFSDENPNACCVV
ncbi:heavy metal-associated isoprenylated plant protein 4 [Ziziphus jujuba]|uniref:Heavy metal-associated isoprenylated plant protein 4 n=1 Tax=Ziziphus jujuba TaxID=326968 RepID=A0A6P4AHY3_ZIZJJ|nr:heavy metal-associated isoprenylated plant protein 4 [Ziziphus jujuba]